LVLIGLVGEVVFVLVFFFMGWMLLFCCFCFYYGGGGDFGDLLGGLLCGLKSVFFWFCWGFCFFCNWCFCCVGFFFWALVGFFLGCCSVLGSAGWCVVGVIGRGVF